MPRRKRPTGSTDINGQEDPPSKKHHPDEENGANLQKTPRRIRGQEKKTQNVERSKTSMEMEFPRAAVRDIDVEEKSFWGLPEELKKMIVDAIPEEIRQKTLLSLLTIARRLKLHAPEEGLLGLLHHKITFAVGNVGRCAEQVIALRNMLQYSKSLHINVLGFQLLSETWAWLLEYLSYKPRLYRMTINGPLTKYTIDAWEHQVIREKNLSAFNIPRYHPMPKGGPVLCASDRLEMLHTLDLRRTGMVNQVQRFSSTGLLRGANIYAFVVVPYDSSMTNSRVQSIFVQEGAPLQLVQKFVIRRDDDAKIRSLTILRAGNDRYGTSFCAPLIASGCKFPLEPRELKLSDTLLESKRITFCGAFTLETITTLSLHRCKGGQALLQELRKHCRQNGIVWCMRAFSYYHRDSGETRDETDAVRDIVNEFLATIMNLQNLLISLYDDEAQEDEEDAEVETEGPTLGIDTAAFAERSDTILANLINEANQERGDFYNWEIETWMKSHRGTLKTACLHIGTRRPSPKDLAILARFPNLEALGLTCKSLAHSVKRGQTVSAFPLEIAQLAISLREMTTVQYLNLAAHVPRWSEDLSTSKQLFLQEMSRLAALILSAGGCGIDCLTLSIEETEVDTNDNKYDKDSCHMRHLNDSEGGLEVGEMSVPWNQEYFGDESVFKAHKLMEAKTGHSFIAFE